jgi:RNA polymerase sigma factor (TIGR02999 family)
VRRAGPAHHQVAAQALPNGALDAVFTLAYEELRRLARAACRREARATLTPTALVNEAWLKLRRSPEVHATSPLHFRRIAARAMRQVLIEAARRRHAGKRGAGEVLVTFDDARHGIETSTSLLALDGALQELAQLSPRQAAVVEARYFGGFDVADTAALLGVSEATVLRDWRAARAWLGAQLSGPRARPAR